MPKGDSIINHPDKDEITQRLLNGESVKQVESWLKMKHPNSRKRWISWMTLQAYRKERLNLEGEVLNEIKEERKDLIKKAKEDQKQELVKQSLGYIQAKKKLVENVLDVETEIVNIHDMIWQRIKIMEQEETKHLNDRVICDYLNQARTLMMDFMKLRENQEKKANSAGGTNININMGEVGQQLGILKQAIREALVEAGAAHVIPLFLDKLGRKLQNTGSDGAFANATVDEGGSVSMTHNQTLNQVNINVTRE